MIFHTAAEPRPGVAQSGRCTLVMYNVDKPATPIHVTPKIHSNPFRANPRHFILSPVDPLTGCSCQAPLAVSVPKSFTNLPGHQFTCVTDLGGLVSYLSVCDFVLAPHFGLSAPQYSRPITSSLISCLQNRSSRDFCQKWCLLCVNAVRISVSVNTKLCTNRRRRGSANCQIQ